MGFFDSKVSRFSIKDTGGTLRDMSAYLVSVRGLPGGRNLDEVTALGDGGAKFIAGLEDVTIALSGIFDDTASTGPGRGARAASDARVGGRLRVRAGGDGFRAR